MGKKSSQKRDRRQQEWFESHMVELVENYAEKHYCCPQCGDFGAPLDYSDTDIPLFSDEEDGGLVNLAKVECEKCGWTGIIHDLVGEINAGID